MKEVTVSENEIFFPKREPISVLGESPVQIENFNKLFLSELREKSGLKLGLRIQVPADAFDKLRVIAQDVLSGEIDEELLKYQMVVLAQTSGLNSTSWTNFKVALNALLDTFQKLPQVEEVMKEFTGSERECLYAQDRMCVKAIFSQALQHM